MIEVALVKLVGAGLTLLSDGYGETAPPGAMEEGYELVAYLLRHPGADQDLVPFTQSIVADIWRRWSEAKLPHDVAQQHVAALPALLDRFRPESGFVTSMIVATLATGRQGVTSNEPALRVTEAIIANARAAGAMGQAGLSEPIIYFFLERLLDRLFADLALVARLRPLVQAFLAECALQARSSQDEKPPEPGAGLDRAAAVTMAPPHLDAASGGQRSSEGDAPKDAVELVAHDFGIPAGALRAISRTKAGVTSSLAEQAAGLQRLIATFAATVPAMLMASAELIAAFREELDSGALEEASHTLGKLEDLHVRAAQTDLAGAPALVPTAAALRAMRGDIDNLAGHWRRAARHYGAAVRCLHQSDRLGRWRFLTQQADALVREGSAQGDIGVLTEGVQIYALAGGLVSELEAPLEWAGTNVKLGNLLLALGEREGRADRFRAAALHFKPAVDLFSRLKATEDWAIAQIGLARALRAQALVQRDVATFEEAAFAFRAALGVATPERMPEEWASALLVLAATMIDLAEETGDIACYGEAAVAYRTLLRAASGAGRLYDAPSVKLRLGDVLLAQAARVNERHLLDEAASALKGALAERERLAPDVAAHAESALGTALWALGEMDRNLTFLSDAARAKLAALDYYEMRGPEDAAFRLRKDLAALEQAIDRLASEARAEAAA